MGTPNKFNENIQLFSPEQMEKIFDELNIKPQELNKTATDKKVQPAKVIDPSQSVEDILKNNFIEEEPPV